jgi:hypothetical protein
MRNKLDVAPYRPSGKLLSLDPRIEKALTHLVGQQPFPILGKKCGVKTLTGQLPIQEPAEHKNITQMLTKRPLVSYRMQGDQLGEAKNFLT